MIIDKTNCDEVMVPEINMIKSPMIPLPILISGNLQNLNTVIISFYYFGMIKLLYLNN